MKMNFDKVRDNYSEGNYTNKREFPRKTEKLKEGYITDENKSVKWNREQVEINKQNYKNLIDLYHREENAKYMLFREDVKEAIVNEYGLSVKQAEFIFTEAYEKAHSDGYEYVIQKANELAQFVYEVKRLKD